MAIEDMAPYGKCPICGKPLAEEGKPFGYGKADEKGRQKKKFHMGLILPMIINMSIESALYKCVYSSRPEYLCCYNEECPACYRAVKPILFTRPIVGQPALRGDSTGIRLSAMKSSYKKKKKK